MPVWVRECLAVPASGRPVSAIALGGGPFSVLRSCSRGARSPGRLTVLEIGVVQ